ncbi:MAG: hypothetical protein ACKPKO_64435, partial [Candidatus Fonsibacter sp.]
GFKSVKITPLKSEWSSRFAQRMICDAMNSQQAVLPAPKLIGYRWNMCPVGVLNSGTGGDIVV